MPVSKKSISNLKPIQKGEVRNPKGKEPGTKNRATIFKKWLEAAGKHGTVEDDVVMGLIVKAKAGDVNAAKEILDSVYGKNTDKMQLSSDPEAPVIFQMDARFKDTTDNS